MTRPQFQTQASQRRDAFRAAREAAGQTQADAARELGVSARAVQQWEGGQRSIPSYALDLYLLRVRRHPTHALVAQPEGHALIAAAVKMDDPPAGRPPLVLVTGSGADLNWVYEQWGAFGSADAGRRVLYAAAAVMACLPAHPRLR